jgi:hypothetical protein
VNEFDAAQFEALGPWITGFEFGGNHYGGQYRADTDSRVLRFISLLVSAVSRNGLYFCSNYACTAPAIGAQSPAITFSRARDFEKIG